MSDHKQAHPELKDPGGMQKEKHAQPDQDSGSAWDFALPSSFSPVPNICAQTEGIGRRLSRLNRLRASNGVDDLIHVEESKRDSKERVHVPRNIGAFADDQEHHDHEVRQSLRVLAGNRPLPLRMGKNPQEFLPLMDSAQN